jgi:hypothetical protein
VVPPDSHIRWPTSTGAGHFHKALCSKVDMIQSNKSAQQIQPPINVFEAEA